MTDESNQKLPGGVPDPATRIAELEAQLAEAQLAELEAKIAAAKASAAAISATAPQPHPAPQPAPWPAAEQPRYAQPGDQAAPAAAVQPPPQPSPPGPAYAAPGPVYEAPAHVPVAGTTEHYIGDDGVEYIVEYVEEEPSEYDLLGYEPIRLTKTEKWLFPFMLLVSQVWLFAQGGLSNVPQKWMQWSLMLEDALFVASFLLLFAVLRRTPKSRLANSTASVAGGLFLGLYIIMVVILCIAKPVEGIAAVVVSVVIYIVWAKWGKPQFDEYEEDDEDVEYVYVDEYGNVIEPS